jgi:hypothetical protein
MKVSIAFFTSVLLGPCSSTGDPTQVGAAAPTATAPVATTASAATPAALTPAALGAAPAGAAATQHRAAQGSPPSGPCATLEQKCRKCPPGAVQIACNGALSAGALDQSACTNALEDKDIKAECGGGATAGGSAAPSPSPSTSPVAPGTGPCAVLAQKCAKCPSGVAKMACQGALAAGTLDQSACTNALADKDIRAQCN